MGSKVSFIVTTSRIKIGSIQTEKVIMENVILNQALEFYG